MSKEIKPGVLCYLVGIPEPMTRNNGRIVEVLSFYGDVGYGKEWWVKPQGVLTQGRQSIFGLEFRESDARCTISEQHLQPINDPDMETDDVTSKDLTKVLQ
jgi:hypothetical protein